MVTYFSMDMTYRGAEGRTSGYIANAPTMDAINAEREIMTRYYEDLGYTIGPVVIEERCLACSGSGVVRDYRRIRHTMKACPDCKGKRSSVEVR